MFAADGFFCGAAILFRAGDAETAKACEYAKQIAVQKMTSAADTPVFIIPPRVFFLLMHNNVMIPRD
jgi:hypothetical protein